MKVRQLVTYFAASSNLFLSLLSQVQELFLFFYRILRRFKSPRKIATFKYGIIFKMSTLITVCVHFHKVLQYN
jgi:hypothetical protein